MQRFTVIVAAVGVFCSANGEASAEVKLKSKKLEATYLAGINSERGDVALSRLTLKPSAKLSLSKRWKADMAFRFEFADDDTGLGSIETFSSGSRPILRSDTTRLEIDRAVLSYKKGKTRLSFGKQSMAWGVLDGIQITDRFDPVRRRDFVFAETRPDRISRWGARWQQKSGDWVFDTGISLDPTVSQLALQDDVFSPTSVRYRAGLPATAGQLPLIVEERDRYLEDATYGLRASRRMGTSTMSALWFSGPETDPVFALSSAQKGAVSLNYPRRDLFGVSFDKAAGPVVIRLEGAHIPDQPLNLRPKSPMQIFRIGEASRTLAGFGVDWNAPGEMFINVQLAMDYIDAPKSDLFGPKADVIYTLKLRRAFKNDTITFNAELIGSAEDRDGAFSADVSYDLSDNVSVSFGANQIFGKSHGTFGQFSQQDRVWTKLKVSM